MSEPQEAEKPLAANQFRYFGEKFAYAEEFPAFEYAEFQEALADDVEANDGRATGVALRLAVACVADADRGRFRKVSRQHRAKVDDWLRVYRDWTAEATELPTGGPTDSSDGPESTPVSSESEPIASVTPIGYVVEMTPDTSDGMERIQRAATPGTPGPRGDLALGVVRSRTA